MKILTSLHLNVTVMNCFCLSTILFNLNNRSVASATLIEGHNYHIIISNQLILFIIIELQKHYYSSINPY